MTKAEANSVELVKLADQYRGLGWIIMQGNYQLDDGSFSFFYTYQSPKMHTALRFDKTFEEYDLLRGESERVAYQNHGVQIDVNLAQVKADLINQLSIVYRKNLEVPKEIVVNNVRIDLLAKYE